MWRNLPPFMITVTVPLLCVYCCLSLCLSVSHSTLLPLYLSTPECNQCSGRVGEVMRGQRVQGQNEHEDHTHEQQHTCEQCSLHKQVWFSPSMHVYALGICYFSLLCQFRPEVTGGSVIHLFLFQDQFPFRQFRGKPRERRPAAWLAQRLLNFCSFWPRSSAPL